MMSNRIPYATTSLFGGIINNNNNVGFVVVTTLLSMMALSTTLVVVAITSSEKKRRKKECNNNNNNNNNNYKIGKLIGTTRKKKKDNNNNIIISKSGSSSSSSTENNKNKEEVIVVCHRTKKRDATLIITSNKTTINNQDTTTTTTAIVGIRNETIIRNNILTTINAFNQLIGNTPFIYLPNLSKLIQRNIYVKMECSNPSGTGKDRAVYNMIQKATTAIAVEIIETNTDNNNNNNTTKNTTTMNNNNNNNNNVSVSLSKAIQNGPLIKKNWDDNDGQSKNDDTTPISENETTTENNNSYSKNEPTLLNDIKVQEEYYQLIIQQAKEKSKTGIIIIEGSSGSTGIAVANQCIGLGHSCIIVLPDDQAIEKQRILQSFPCCCTYVVPTAAISNPNHYVNIAKYITYLINNNTTTTITNDSERQYRAIFLNQFENLDNYIIHYEQTGPELYEQFHQYVAKHQPEIQNPTIDAFVMSAGTGGTITGIGHYLKDKTGGNVQIVLADPIGSSLGNKIRYGIAFTSEQCERTIQKHRYDTIVEGVGLDRITANFNTGIPIIDNAITVTDQEAIDIAHYILKEEGLFIGSSTAINLVATIRTAVTTTLPPSSNLITIVCDTGFRHLTRFWNPNYIINERNLIWPPYSDTPRIPECLQPFVSM